MQKIKSFFVRYPLLGMRTLKTVIAVVVTSLFMKYVLGQNPFFACIGAIVALERTIETSIKAAVARNIGTITGGLIGMAIGSLTDNILIMSLGLIPFIWLHNLIGRTESIVPGAIVYFAVFYLNSTQDAWSYGLIRIGGTLIGTIIALAINALIFPPKGREIESAGAND